MTQKETLAQIKAAGMAGRFDPNAGEYRVSFPASEMPDKDEREAAAYYTNDSADAVETAAQMRAQAIADDMDARDYPAALQWVREQQREALEADTMSNKTSFNAEELDGGALAQGQAAIVAKIKDLGDAGRAHLSCSVSKTLEDWGGLGACHFPDGNLSGATGVVRDKLRDCGFPASDALDNLAFSLGTVAEMVAAESKGQGDKGGLDNAMLAGIVAFENHASPTEIVDQLKQGSRGGEGRERLSENDPTPPRGSGGAASPLDKARERNNTPEAKAERMERQRDRLPRGLER